MLTKCIVIIISQCIQISNHVMHLKYHMAVVSQLKIIIRKSFNISNYKRYPILSISAQLKPWISLPSRLTLLSEKLHKTGSLLKTKESFG